MIELITFTGVDDRTSLSDLTIIAKRYPQTEFAVLTGSPGNAPLFPTEARINLLRRTAVVHDFPVAIHLCGVFARSIMAGQWQSFAALYAGFDRIQVNLHGDMWDPKDIDVKRDAMMRFADYVAPTKVILQHRARWDDVPVRHESVEYLFDLSGGRGMDFTYAWPAPTGDLERVGYAGGLGPGNMERALEFASDFPEQRIWFDMEGRIRTDARFDLEKVEQVCQEVWT